MLDRLKHDPQTRHVPVAVVSTDEARERALGCRRVRLPRQADRRRRPGTRAARPAEALRRSAAQRTLLAVSADAARLRLVRRRYLAADDVKVIAAASVAAARARIGAQGTVDCIVWDARARSRPADARMPRIGGRPRSRSRWSCTASAREARRDGMALRWATPVVVHEARTPRGAARSALRSCCTGRRRACRRRTARCCATSDDAQRGAGRRSA